MAERVKIGMVVPPQRVDQLFRAEHLQRLEAMGEVVRPTTNDKLDEAQASELLQGCAIGIGSWGTVHPNAGLLSACPDLRLWVHAAGSVRAIMNALPSDHALTVASCSPAIAEGVAEYTLGALIVGVRQAMPNAVANRTVTAGNAAAPGARELCECTVGVVGASQVGRRLIRNLQPFEPHILLFDPFVTEQQARALDVELVGDLTELCRRSDAVTLHTPSLPATDKMMGAEQFQAMADQAVFVNTSRGSCVDEAALIAELAKGRLFAFIDVTQPEPAAPDSPLRSLSNVVLTSHLAGRKSPRIGAQVVRDIAAYFDGRSPECVVTADMLDRVA